MNHGAFPWGEFHFVTAQPKVCVSVKVKSISSAAGSGEGLSGGGGVGEAKGIDELVDQMVNQRMFDTVDKYDMALYSLYANCEVVVGFTITGVMFYKAPLVRRTRTTRWKDKTFIMKVS